MAEQRFLLDQHGSVLRTVDYDPWSVDGTRDGGRMLWSESQECDGIVAANLRDREVDQSKRMFRHAARIPMPVVAQAFREGWADDTARWRRWLNDPDNAAFRVWQGRV